MRYEIEESSDFKDRAKSVNVHVDGRKMTKRVSLPPQTHGAMNGVRTSDNTMRPFTFADIQTTGAPDRAPFQIILSCLAYALYSRIIQMKTDPLTTSIEIRMR